MNRKGFSLVELMTVIVIIGILAAVAMPAYSKYIMHTKLAEAYTSLEALTKAEEVFYSEHGHFTSIYTMNFRSGGSKYTMDSLYPGGMLLAEAQANTKLIGNPLGFGNGEARYFMYNIEAGFFDAAGSSRRVSYELDGTPTFSPHSATALRLYFRDDAASNDCTRDINFSDINIQGIPNEHWAVIGVVADFSDEVGNTCTTALQTLRGYGEVTANPVVMLNLGE